MSPLVLSFISHLSRSPILATAYVDKHLDDLVCIPAPWDIDTLRQFHPETALHRRPFPTFQPHFYLFCLPFYCFMLSYHHCHPVCLIDVKAF